MEIALMVHSTGTGAAMAPIEIKKLPTKPAEGYNDNKIAEALSGFHGLGGNRPFWTWNGKR
jgi:hypothetical protein